MLTFSRNESQVFLTDGFSSWKDATRAFEKHETSATHKESQCKWLQYSRGVSVAVQIHGKHIKEQELPLETFHFTAVFIPPGTSDQRS